MTGVKYSFLYISFMNSHDGETSFLLSLVAIFTLSFITSAILFLVSFLFLLAWFVILAVFIVAMRAIPTKEPVKKAREDEPVHVEDHRIGVN